MQIEQQIRGLFDKPIAYTTYQNFDVKIYEGYAVDLKNTATPGTIIEINKDGIAVACGDNKLLRITKLQLPSKKPINVKEMINGNHPFKVNETFTY
jgi:methionyl-tRNA formyltransferase